MTYESLPSIIRPNQVPAPATLNKVMTLKVSPAQMRRMKEAARAEGLRMSVWARNILIMQANKAVGARPTALLPTPTLPE